MLVFNQPSGSYVVPNAISDPGGGQGTVVQVGTGSTVVLTASNSYTGGTSVGGGVLAVENTSAIPSGSLVEIGSQGSLVLGTPGAKEPLGSLSGAGPLTSQPSAGGGQVASPALGGGVNAVPEPGTLALLAAAAACGVAAAWRRRRRD
jgi:autotransporter-associated beta strand protein